MPILDRAVGTRGRHRGRRDHRDCGEVLARTLVLEGIAACSRSQGHESTVSKEGAYAGSTITVTSESAESRPKAVTVIKSVKTEPASAPVTDGPQAKKKRGSSSAQAAVSAVNDDLVREILASPDDDGPRLVLADRLMERGDPRGEFIQIQCMLGHTIEGPKGRIPHLVLRAGETDVWTERIRERFATKDAPNRVELEAREVALYKRHVKDWLGPVRPFIRTFQWRRGFLDHVDAPAAAFFDGAEVVLAAHPVTVTLEKLDRSALERLKVAPLSALRALNVSGIKPRHVDALLGENLQNVETLGLVNSPVGDEGAIRLASESRLRSLRWLSARYSEIGDAGLSAIAGSPIFERLEMLDLERAPLTNAGLRALVESKMLPRLRHVRLVRAGESLEASFDRDLVAGLERRLLVHDP